MALHVPQEYHLGPVADDLELFGTVLQVRAVSLVDVALIVVGLSSFLPVEQVLSELLSLQQIFLTGYDLLLRWKHELVRLDHPVEII